MTRSSHPISFLEWSAAVLVLGLTAVFPQFGSAQAQVAAPAVPTSSMSQPADTAQPASAVIRPAQHPSASPVARGLSISDALPDGAGAPRPAGQAVRSTIAAAMTVP